MKSIPEDTHEAGIHSGEIDSDTTSSDLFARLERYGAKAQAVGTRGDGRERGSNTSSEAVTQRSLDEPLTPELVLVDPELARRAREQLPEREPERRPPARVQASPSEAPVFGFIQPTAATTRALDHPHHSPKRRLAVQILVVTILGVAAGFAIMHVESLKRFFSESRETSVVPTGGGKSPANVSRGETEARQKGEPKPHTANTRRTSPSNRSAKRKTRPAIRPAAESARGFAWVAAPGAAYYLVQFYHGAKEIFRAHPSAPRLLLPARWSFKGDQYSLAPGRYRWSVRPGYGRRSQARYRQPIVRAKLVIQRSSGG